VIGPKEFDSKLEHGFAARWVADPAASEWELTRECDILDAGQTAYAPDFTLCHRDGTRVHVEAMGFWSPEYLKH
jgi:predicted nuclease of restriction endonuclease-like RecB superfamily